MGLPAYGTARNTASGRNIALINFCFIVTATAAGPASIVAAASKYIQITGVSTGRRWVSSGISIGIEDIFGNAGCGHIDSRPGPRQAAVGISGIVIDIGSNSSTGQSANDIYSVIKYGIAGGGYPSSAIDLVGRINTPGSITGTAAAAWRG